MTHSGSRLCNKQCHAILKVQIQCGASVIKINLHRQDPSNGQGLRIHEVLETLGKTQINTCACIWTRPGCIFTFCRATLCIIS